MPHTRRVKLAFPTSQVGECGSLSECSEQELLETRWNTITPFPLEDVEDNFLQSTNTYSFFLHFLSLALVATGSLACCRDTYRSHLIQPGLQFSLRKSRERIYASVVRRRVNSV